MLTQSKAPKTFLLPTKWVIIKIYYGGKVGRRDCFNMIL